MAMKRKRVTRRRTTRRVRPRRRTTRRSQNFLSTRRTFYSGNWAPNTATTDGFWKYYTINLGSLPSMTEFTSLFDQYRIKAVKFTLRPKYDSFGGNDTTDTTLPGITNQAGTMVHVVKDKFSQLAPSGTYTSPTLNMLMEQGYLKTYMGVRPINIYIPRPVVYQTVASGSRPVTSPWLNTGDTLVSHRGCHVFMQDPAFNGSFGQSFDVYVTLYMQFKNMK